MPNNRDTKKQRDAEINHVIDKYKINNSDSNTNKSNIEKKIQKNIQKSKFISFTILSVILAFVLSILYSFASFHKYTFKKLIPVLIGLFSLLFIFNIFSFIVVKDTDSLNITRTVKTSGYTFSIVAITYVLLFFTPRLINVFANTVGYFIISTFKISKFTQVMSAFKSKLFPNSSEYGFNIPFNWLITTFNTNNIEDAIGTKEKEGQISRSRETDTRFDFYIDIKDDSKCAFINDLKNLVETKEQIGHFVWLYLAIVTAVLISTHELIK